MLNKLTDFLIFFLNAVDQCQHLIWGPGFLHFARYVILTVPSAITIAERVRGKIAMG